MPKIIIVNDSTITIGFEDGSMREVRREDCTFKPAVGDFVEVFANENSVIVNKVGPTPSFDNPNAQMASQGGININVANEISPNPQFYATPGGKVVNKTTYVLLALFLGGLGVHEFYAGKTGLGILYLLFCWTFIPAIIALIEAIIALTKPSDAAGNIII